MGCDQCLKIPKLKPAQKFRAKAMRQASQNSNSSAFETASQQRAPNVVVEFMDFLVHNKKWWLTPIILVLLLFSVFIALTSSAIAPFIYVLF